MKKNMMVMLIVLAGVFSTALALKTYYDSVEAEKKVNETNGKLLDSQSTLIERQNALNESQGKVIELTKELSNKQEELIIQQSENLNYLTGAASFCLIQMDLRYEEEKYQLYFDIINIGKYPLTNVHVGIINNQKQLKKFEEKRNVKSWPTRKDFDFEYQYDVPFIKPTTILNVDGEEQIIGMQKIGSVEVRAEEISPSLDFTAYFSIPSGAYSQRIKLRNHMWDPSQHPYGLWFQASKVIKSDNGIQYEKISPVFYITKEEEEKGIDWTLFD